MSNRDAVLSLDGMDYSRMDETTEAEKNAFRDFYTRSKGYSIPAHEFMLEFRPDVLKRYRYWAHMITSEAEAGKPLSHVIAMMHHYAIIGYDDGILYEIRLSQFGGATKGEILDALAVAALHGHPRGTRAVASSSTEYMRTYQDPPHKDRWPTSWSFDPHAFDAGLDYSTPEATKDDMAKIMDWYQTVNGEVPRYIRFMAEFRPRMLKAYRDRYERAIRDGLPKQMLPFLLLHQNTMRGFGEGIRENVLLGRHLGMNRDQLTDAVFWAMYGSPENYAVVEDVAGDILRAMD